MSKTSSSLLGWEGLDKLSAVDLVSPVHSPCVGSMQFISGVRYLQSLSQLSETLLTS